MNELIALTTDEWVFFGILVAIIYAVGGVPRLVQQLFGRKS
jgi:hypothetical protein